MWNSNAHLPKPGIWCCLKWTANLKLVRNVFPFWTMWSGHHLRTKNTLFLPTDMQSNCFYLGFLNCPKFFYSVQSQIYIRWNQSCGKLRFDDHWQNIKWEIIAIQKSSRKLRKKLPVPSVVNTMFSNHLQKSVLRIAKNINKIFQMKTFHF